MGPRRGQPRRCSKPEPRLCDRAPYRGLDRPNVVAVVVVVVAVAVAVVVGRLRGGGLGAADETAGEGAGVLALVVDLLAVEERVDVAVGLPQQPPPARRKVVPH